MRLERLRFLCREWEIQYYEYTAYRLTAMALSKKEILENVVLLEKKMTVRQNHLSDLHVKCFQGLGDASLFTRKLYAFYMPGAIGGSIRKASRGIGSSYSHLCTVRRISLG